jgi:hypothetical protein
VYVPSRNSDLTVIAGTFLAVAKVTLNQNVTQKLNMSYNVMLFFILKLLGYGIDDRGSIPGGGRDFFSSSPPSNRLWGPPSLVSNGVLGAPFPGIKRPEREADYSLPSNAEINNA